MEFLLLLLLFFQGMATLAKTSAEVPTEMIKKGRMDTRICSSMDCMEWTYAGWDAKSASSDWWDQACGAHQG